MSDESDPRRRLLAWVAKQHWEVAPRAARYRAEGTPSQMAALKSLGLDSFEALSVGQGDGGQQVAFVPLDESSEDAAQAIAALPDLVRALGVDSCAAALWDVERDRWWRERISNRDPGPCVRGTHILVADIVSRLQSGATVDDVLRVYPDIERVDVVASVEHWTRTKTEADHGDGARLRGVECPCERTGHCSCWGPNTLPCAYEASESAGRCCYCDADGTMVESGDDQT